MTVVRACASIVRRQLRGPRAGRELRRLERAKRFVQESGLFRADHYVGLVGEDVLRGWEPIEHFVRHGNQMRINPHPLFDTDFYLEANPDVRADGINALVHFLEHGWREGRDPHPLFDIRRVGSQIRESGNPLLVYIASGGREIDPCALFDTKYFLVSAPSAMPDQVTPLEYFLACPIDRLWNPHPYFNVAAYLAARPDILPLNPLYHFRRYDGRSAAAEVSADPLILLQAYEAGMMVRHASEIEPAVIVPGVKPESYALSGTPYKLSAKYQLARNAGMRIVGRAATAIVLISFMRRGGAELEAMNVVRAMLGQDPAARILVIATDPGTHEALDWVIQSDRLTLITFQELAPDATEDERVFVLAHLVSSIEAGLVINCNSNIGWLAYERYGRRLSRHSRLAAMLFCYDYDAFGARCGYATRFLQTTIEDLEIVLIDNAAFKGRLVADMGLPSHLADKLHVVYHPPTPPRVKRDPRQTAERIRSRNARAARRVLWAGRPTRQKRPDILIAVARLLPDVVFHCAGGHRADFVEQKEFGSLPRNLMFLGPYASLQADLPISSMDAFFHTARWEGLPNVIVDAVAAGLPVVATDVGGVREIINDETGWLVSPTAQPEDFAAALSSALNDADLVERRLVAARLLVDERHGHATFTDRLGGLGIVRQAKGATHV